MSQPEAPVALDHTQSLCPICFQVLDAQIVVRAGAVFLHKVCPNHGPMSVYLWPDVAHYNWMRSFRVPFKPALGSLERERGCPLDCGPCTTHLRHATLVEVEVTQRCNLHCPVCFMAAGSAPPDLSLAELEAMYTAIRQQSGEWVGLQLTGGEPTLRPDLPEIVALGRRLGFGAIEINTNGLALAADPAYAVSLARAGASGIYLQFDGLSPDAYRQIRGADLLQTKLRAIVNCRAAGIQVVLAMTVIQGVNHDQLGAVLDYALENLDVIAGLAFQPAFTSGRFKLDMGRRLSMGDVAFLLAGQSGGRIDAYDLWPLGCSHPLCSCATYLLVEDGAVTPLTRRISPDEYRARFNGCSPQGSVFADILAQDGAAPHTGLSIVIMNYMDAGTLDLKRLQECSMLVALPDGRQIPFCAYQLSGLDGARLYPAWGRVEQEKSSDG